MRANFLFNGALFLLFFALAFGFAHAAISTPAQILAGNSFLISDGLLAQSAFTSAQVFYDNKLIVTVDNSGSVTVDPSNGKFVIKAFSSNDDVANLYMVYLEKSSGNHTIHSIIYNNTDIAGDETKTISVLDSLPGGGDTSGLASRITSVEQSVSSLQTQTASLNSSIGASSTGVEALDSNLSGLAAEVNSIKSVIGNASTTGTISLIQQKALQDELGAVEARLSDLNAKLVSLQGDSTLQKDKIISLMQAGSAEDPLTFVLLAAVIILAVVVGYFGFIKGGLLK